MQFIKLPAMSSPMAIDTSLREELAELKAARDSARGGLGTIAGGGGGAGPHDPGMESRIVALETDMKDVKGSLGRLEVASGRIEATLASLATRADVAITTERIASLDGRTKKVEDAITDTVRTAVGKAIGPWQLPGVLAACGTIVVLIVAALGWLAHQPWFTH